MTTCERCLGTGMLEIGDDLPVDNSCPICKPWADNVAHCAQCKWPMLGIEETASCDRCKPYIKLD